jgi:hypothetical protein
LGPARLQHDDQRNRLQRSKGRRRPNRNGDLQGGEKKIDIPANVPVVALVPSTAADIRAGEAVFVPGERQADGSIHAGAVLFGKDGLIPPM